MARLAFTFSYQAFTRYVRDNCDSEQEVDGSRVDEKWLYGNMNEYLHAKASHLYDFSWEKVKPAEFQTGRAGGPRAVDLVCHSRRKAEDGAFAIVLEAKLMVDENRPWAQEIITDLLRVSCMKDRTNRRTHRYVMVVGQERCWDRLESQCGGLLPRIAPFVPKRNPKTLWLTRKRKTTTFSKAWRKECEGAIEEYLRPLLPAGIDVELTGCSQSHRGPDEQPEAGMTARLWRVYPR